LKSYIWRPIKSHFRHTNRKEIINQLTLSVEDILDRNELIERYEMPVLLKHIPHIKNVFPNLKTYSFYENNKLYTQNEIIDLNNNMPEADDYLFNLFASNASNASFTSL
jgi:hypothetical protein